MQFDFYGNRHIHVVSVLSSRKLFHTHREDTMKIYLFPELKEQHSSS